MNIDSKYVSKKWVKRALNESIITPKSDEKQITKRVVHEHS